MDTMRLPLVAAVFCLLVVSTKGADESSAHSSPADQLTSARTEKDIQGPLLQALIAPVEMDSNADSTTADVLRRDKRHHKKWFNGGGGGCTSNCGGGGQPLYLVVNLQKAGGYQKGSHQSGGGCGYGGCGGGQVYHQPSGGGCGNNGCGQVYQQPVGGCGGYGCGSGSSSSSFSQASASSYSESSGYGKK